MSPGRENNNKGQEVTPDRSSYTPGPGSFLFPPLVLILKADARAIPLADKSVQCVVTSPPYWGLRDYGADGQLGLEKTPEEHVEHMVQVFREVRRVLRDDGTLWLNYGDCYAANMKGSGGASEKQDSNAGSRFEPRKFNHGLKPKDLVGMPWLIAKALQAPYYTGNIKSEHDRIWLAAMMDGEGTICGFTHKRKDDGRIRTGINIGIVNSCMALLDKAQEIWPTSRQDHNPHGEGHLGELEVRRWVPHGVEKKALLMQELYPYLIAKKNQTMLAWNLLEFSKKAKSLGRSKQGDEMRAKRKWIVDALSLLNHAKPVDIPSWIKEPSSCYEPGWYLRSDIIWSKPNPMPESVTDRPTKAHEYVFLLTKKAKYFYDADAVREEGNHEPHGPGWATSMSDRKDRQVDNEANKRDWGARGTRNRRTVWEIATQPCPMAHFATFPEKLVEPCIKAGTSERGCCEKCGAPWVRVVERGELIMTSGAADKRIYKSPRTDENDQGVARSKSHRSKCAYENKTTGWKPQCSCNAGRVPCIVYDPFGGTGTVASVALKLGRRAIVSDIHYHDLAKQRIFA